MPAMIAGSTVRVEPVDMCHCPPPSLSRDDCTAPLLTTDRARAAQIMFVLFTVVTVLWTTVVLRARPNSHRIHYLMIVLCVFKSLTLLSQAGMYHLIRAIGHAEGWSVAFYLFTFIRGVLFFTVRAATRSVAAKATAPDIASLLYACGKATPVATLLANLNHIKSPSGRSPATSKSSMGAA